MKLFFSNKSFESAVDRIVQERLPAAVSDQISMIGWRKLTGAPTRELPMMDQARALEVAYWLWKTNPLAKWIIEVTTAFVTAKGFPVTAKNDEVAEVLKNFWEDPVNRMDIHWDNFVRELGIYGEQCWPMFVAEQTGRIRLGYVDPAYIQEVLPDPHNVKIKLGLTVGSHDGTATPRRLQIVLDSENEDFLSPEGRQLRESFTDGECFFFTVNALTNEMRGTSDLFTQADHLEAYEQFLFDSAEKYAQFNSFFYDITVKDATEKELEEKRSSYQPPRTGEAFIHNEKVTAEAVAPEMKASDADKAARLHRNHILGSLGIPEHWYGGGGDVNRATAAEMDAPARKMIEARQTKTKNMLDLMFDIVIGRAVEAGYLRGVPEDELYSYEVQTPEISDKDVAKLSTMLQQTATALTVAETQGWIGKGEAAKAFAYFLAFVGYEYDPDEQDAAPEYQDYKDKQTPPEKPADGEDAA